MNRVNWGKTPPACIVVGFGIYMLQLPSSEAHQVTWHREENAQMIALAYGTSMGLSQVVIWKTSGESTAWLTHVSAWSVMISCVQCSTASALGFQGQSSPAPRNAKKLQ